MTRGKTALLLGAVLLAFGGVASAHQPNGSPAPFASPTLNRAEDDARSIDLLRSAMGAPRTISYVGQIQWIRWGPSGASASIAKVEHRAPDKTHRLFVAPETMYGDMVVIRGTTSYAFSMKKQHVVVNRGLLYDSEASANDNFGLLIANYRPVLSANETVAGRNTVPISLINRYTGERMMRLWVDANSKIVLQKESYHANGAVASRTSFDRIRYTSDIPVDLFSTAIPKGFTQTVGREATAPSTDLERTLKAAGFTPAGPHYLPEGFTILNADVATVKGVKSLHLLYSDGVRTLSLFENANGAAADFGGLRPIPTHVESHEAQYVNDGPTTLLSWKEAGLSLALVGDLDIKEMIAIAASVVP